VSAFSDFVLEIAPRLDAYGVYQSHGRAVWCKEPITAEVIAAHENGTRTIGIPCASAARGCTFAVLDYDNHDGDPSRAQANHATALDAWNLLREMGAEPILEDSDGQGGFHVWVFFAEPAQLMRAHAFIAWAAGGKAEAFPKQAVLRDGDFGNWVRLPGKHPRRNHWSRVWDGFRWLDPEDTWTFFAEHARCPLHVLDMAQVAHPHNHAPKSSVADFADVLRPGERNNRLFALACAMRGQGFGEQAILAAMLEENRERCEPPLPEDEVRALARSATRYPAGDPGGVTPPAGERREDILQALNAALSAGNRPVCIEKIVRRDRSYEVSFAGCPSAVPLSDISKLRKFDFFADAVLEGVGVELDRKLRRSWPTIAQMLRDVVEEGDAESETEETTAWLEAARAANAVLDADDEEGAAKVGPGLKLPFFSRGGKTYALLSPLRSWLDRTGLVRCGRRELARRLARCGWRKSRLGFGPQGNQRRVTAWVEP